MKYRQGETIGIWDQLAEIIEVQEELKRYKILCEGEKEYKYVSDEQIDFNHIIYFLHKRSNKVYKKECSYGINPIYDNLPALGGRDYRGEFDRIDYIQLREATAEEIDQYNQKRDEYKWEAIDREFGELKVGDIIQYDGELIMIHIHNLLDYQDKEIVLICANEFRFDKAIYANF